VSRHKVESGKQARLDEVVVMNEEIKEQLSALVDDELPEHEREFLLSRMQGDIDLKQCWGRYNLIRDALHNELPHSIDISLADRVMDEVNNIPAEPSLPNLQELHLQEHSSVQFLERISRTLKPVAGFAVAASVAAITLFGVQNILYLDEDVQNGTQVASTVSYNRSEPGYVRTSGTRWDTARKEVESRLTAYLVNHNEYSSTTNLQGMMPYVLIAGYDARR
jgi:sigma-E factor negative regulatory protein RseA